MSESLRQPLLYDDDTDPYRRGILDRLRLAPPPPDPRAQGPAPWSGLPPAPGYTEARPSSVDTFTPLQHGSGDLRAHGRREIDALAGDAPPTIASRISLDTGGIIGGWRGALTSPSALGMRLRSTLPQAEADAAARPGMTTDADTWARTGWQLFPDGRMRMELPDTDARILPQAQAALQGNGPVDLTLRDILRHDELYRAYPAAGDASVRINAPTSETQGYQAFFEPVPGAPFGGRIVMGQSANPDFRSILLHEAQHGVQRWEGHAPGTNPSSGEVSRRMGDMADERRQEIARLIAERDALFNEMRTTHPDATPNRRYEELERRYPGAEQRLKDLRAGASSGPNAYQFYQAALGEAEARAVQDRLLWSPEELRLIPPLDTMRLGPSRAEMGPNEWWNPDALRLRIRREGGLLE